jgi:hypothetical protein
MQFHAPQAVVVMADDGVRPVLDRVARQRDLVALQAFDPAGVAPVVRHDHDVRDRVRRRDRLPVAPHVGWVGLGGDDRVDARLPEVLVRIAVVRAHP